MTKESRILELKCHCVSFGNLMSEFLRLIEGSQHQKGVVRNFFCWQKVLSAQMSSAYHTLGYLLCGSHFKRPAPKVDEAGAAQYCLLYLRRSCRLKEITAYVLKEHVFIAMIETMTTAMALGMLKGRLPDMPKDNQIYRCGNLVRRAFHLNKRQN